MDQPPATGSPALVGRARRPGGPEEGPITALEPSEPSREARAQLRLAMAARAAIGHPNLLRAWAVGEAESRLFVAFERCQYPSLTELLATGPLEPADCARVFDGAASGVDALSRQGLVARNLTPERVLVDPRHGGILMDLGVPPELMRPLPLEQDPDLAFRSPEELRGQPVDVRSSVYSLGVFLFTALTGSRPYGGTQFEIYSSHLDGVPPRPSEPWLTLSPEDDAVVARAMAADPADRYPDARALSRAVKAAADRAAMTADLKPDKRRPQPARKPAPAPPKPRERPTRTAAPSEEPPTPRAQERSQPRPANAGRTGKRPTNAPRQPRPAPKRETPHSRVAPSKRRRAEAPTTHAAEDQAQLLPAGNPPAPGPPEARQAPRAEDRRRAPRAAETAPAQHGAQEQPKSRPVDPPSKSESVGVRQVPQPAKVRPTPQLPEPGPASGPAHRFAAGVRGCVALMATLLVLAGAAGPRIQAGLRRFAVSVRRLATEGRGAGSAAQRGSAWRHRFAAAVGRVARGAAGVAAQTAGRGATAVRGLFLRASRLVHRAAERVDVLVKRLALFAGGAGPRTRRFASIRSMVLSPPSHAKLVLAAVAAIVASGLSGIALGAALEAKGGTSSITRAGLTVLLPPGWEPAEIKPGRPALTSPIAAVPSGETKAGFVVGTLGSQTAAERMFEGVQHAGERRTHVRLGGLLGWRYAGLQPGPRLVGAGYLLPLTNGAVVMLCHASKGEGRARLAECARAATTIVVGGERLRELTSVDRSREQLIGAIATLRSSRSEGRERLAAADLAPGQIRAAIALKVSHQRAARSVEQISPLENGHSLEDMATALRAAAAAYDRLAGAVATGSRPAYREARRAVAREEEAFRRELVRVSAP
jgi:serine/threonine protein kinase